MGSLAVFGIANDGLNLVVSLLILFVLVFWLALIYWTNADARRRIEDPMLVGCATAAALFPFAGTLVYMIVRPPEYIDDRRERELEIAAAEARLASIEHLSCPYCAFDIERSFLRCPSCLRRLKEPCGTCGKPLDPRWKICPYCEAEIGRPQPQPRRPQRRQRPAAATAPAEPARARPADAARRRKAPRASPAQPQAAPAAGNGEPARPVSAAPATQRKAAPPARPGEGPAPPQRGQPRSPAEGGRAQRSREGSRPPRAPDPAARPGPPSSARKTRSGASAPEQPASDEVAAERPATRPRTRPPSAG